MDKRDEGLYEHGINQAKCDLWCNVGYRMMSVYIFSPDDVIDVIKRSSFREGYVYAPGGRITAKGIHVMPKLIKGIVIKPIPLDIFNKFMKPVKDSKSTSEKGQAAALTLTAMIGDGCVDLPGVVCDVTDQTDQYACKDLKLADNRTIEVKFDMDAGTKNPSHKDVNNVVVPYDSLFVQTHENNKYKKH